MRFFKSNIPLSGILVLILIAVSQSGCDDNFLSIAPEDRVSTTNFFENENEVEQAVIGAYAKTRDMFDLQFRLTELRSDNTTVQWNQANRGPHPNWLIDEFTMEAANVIIEPYWGHVYEGIQRCNTVLSQIDNVSFSSEGLKSQLTAETKFLRAFYYFNLVRLFGKVPLILEQVQSPDQSFSTIEERAEIEQIYQQILTDAGDAAAGLPVEYSGTNQGRATEGAARALLADVHLTLENYSESVSNMERIIEIGYALLPDYTDIFDPNNKYHAEAIFDIQYAALENSRNLGSQFIYEFAPHNSGTQITGDNARAPVGLNLPTQSMYNAYEAGDERKDASIAKFVDPSNREQGIAVGDTIYFVNKFAYPNPVFGAGNQNWPVYRFGQVLLMMAEAINELEGPTAEAYSAVNRIRQRAGLGNLAPGLSQSDFRDAVAREQRVELAFENDRWFNLLRTQRAGEVMRAHGDAVRDLQPHFREPAYMIEDFKFLYPIPQREISLNSNLGQNPGW